MIELQIISKVLTDHDDAILQNNLLTRDYFRSYSAEYDFIQEHKDKYGNVPDIPTFLAKFPDITLVDCNESDQYLVNALREEDLYFRSIPVVKHVAELLKADANQAAEYMLNAVKELTPRYALGGTDIISGATDRLEQFRERKSNPD